MKNYRLIELYVRLIDLEEVLNIYYYWSPFPALWQLASIYKEDLYEVCELYKKIENVEKAIKYHVWLWWYIILKINRRWFINKYIK